MKKPIKHNHFALLLGIILCGFLTPLFAQDEEEVAAEETNKPERPAFESSWIIDNQTVVVPQKGTLEFMIQHRFGTVSNGITDLWGLYAPSNIRLGFNYTLFDNFGFGALKGPLSIGFGTTKNNRVQDVNIKYGIMRQTRSGSIPVSISYYGNAAMETQLAKENLPNKNESDRYSFFHQIIIARRFSSKLSVQVAPSISHFNTVRSFMKNDHIAVAVAGRYKISSQTSVIVGIDQPITDHTSGNPQPNVSFGLEIATSSHAFQIFMTNYSSIVPQRNNVFNQNDPTDDGFLIGFNITRLWNFN